MRHILEGSQTGMRGLDELEELFRLIREAGVAAETEFDLSLARGLNYYTGAIFEVKALDFTIGSICGGGRYDDLTGIFGLSDTSGVGISFGADRIYDSSPDWTSSPRRPSAALSTSSPTWARPPSPTS